MWPSHLVKCRIPFESSVVAWWESFWLFPGMPVALNVEATPSTFKILTLNKAASRPSCWLPPLAEIVSLVKQYQPICTIILYLNNFKAFDLSNPDHCVFFFTPHSTVQNVGSFSPDIHLSLAVILLWTPVFHLPVFYLSTLRPPKLILFVSVVWSI